VNWSRAKKVCGWIKWTRYCNCSATKWERYPKHPTQSPEKSIPEYRLKFASMMSKNEMKANHNLQEYQDALSGVGKYDVKERDESKSKP
jgi:hypothetical protein